MKRILLLTAALLVASPAIAGPSDQAQFDSLTQSWTSCMASSTMDDKLNATAKYVKDLPSQSFTKEEWRRPDGHTLVVLRSESEACLVSVDGHDVTHLKRS